MIKVILPEGAAHPLTSSHVEEIQADFLIQLAVVLLWRWEMSLNEKVSEDTRSRHGLSLLQFEPSTCRLTALHVLTLLHVHGGVLRGFLGSNSLLLNIWTPDLWESDTIKRLAVRTVHTGDHVQPREARGITQELLSVPTSSEKWHA